MIQVDEILELDNNLLTTGVINVVKKIDFDRNELRSIDQPRYDDCFVLREKDAINMRLKANSTKV